MNTWEYALLVRRREASGQNWRISFYWYAPDGDRQDVTQFGDTAIAQLNLAGKKGWELVSSEEDINNLQGSTEVHRYYLKRPSAV